MCKIKKEEKQEDKNMRYIYSIQDYYYGGFYDVRKDGIIEVDNEIVLQEILEAIGYRLLEEKGVIYHITNSTTDEYLLEDKMKEDLDICYWKVDEDKAYAFSSEKIEQIIKDQGLDSAVNLFCSPEVFQITPD